MFYKKNVWSIITDLKQTPADYNTTADGWLEWRGSQYFFSPTSMAMEEARHVCQRNHGDLVSISTKDENTFLWKQVMV